MITAYRDRARRLFESRTGLPREYMARWHAATQTERERVLADERDGATWLLVKTEYEKFPVHHRGPTPRFVVEVVQASPSDIYTPMED